MVRNQKIDAAARQQEKGIYTCSSCGNTLFLASKKFEVGSGFPSFWAPIGEHVQQHKLNTYGRERIQVLCQQCGQHLGHLFEDNRTPTQLRYCINAEAIQLEKE